jgi:UDP:flavonoid glycosyltransferase YjiC (YdhE family)
MRIILTCWGSHGDVFPYLALARGLAARGATPVIATLPYYRDMVGGAGFEFVPVRPDLDPSDYDLIARLMDPAKGSEIIVRELVAPHVRTAFEDLRAGLGDARLLVSHPLTFACRMVAETTGRPWISVALAPSSFFSIHDFPTVPPHLTATRLARHAQWSARLVLTAAHLATRKWTAPVRAFRAELGLPPIPNPLFAGQFSPYGTLALFSRVVAQPQADWPANTTETGFPFYDEDTPLPEDLDAFLEAGEPPVVFTLGTSASGAAGAFYEESLEAVRIVGCRAVLVTGRDPRNRPSGPLPSSVIAVDYAPHRALFARASVIVHHAGVGTLAQALRAGRPMLIVPHAHDQHDNSRRACTLGVAREIDAPKYRAARVARDLAALLSDADYLSRARAAAEVIASERGVEAACDVLLRAAEAGPTRSS